MRRAEGVTMRGRRPLWAHRLLPALLAALLVLPLAGWSNGGDRGNGFGTHDWVLYEADRLAAESGYRWLDWRAAQPVTDDPDTVLHDYYHHVYDVWGERYGDAPVKVSELYGEVVAELKAGDTRAASRTFGLLSHYYADASDPLHTDQTAEEERVHASWERAAQRLTDEPGENAGWVVPDGIARVRDVEAETRRTAETAHSSYAALVRGYAAGRMTPQVLDITRTSLGRAANGLADLIASAALDSGVARSPGKAPAPDADAASATTAPAATPSAEASETTASAQEPASGTAETSTPPQAAASASAPASAEAAPRPAIGWLFAAVGGAVLAAALTRALRGRRH